MSWPETRDYFAVALIDPTRAPPDALVDPPATSLSDDPKDPWPPPPPPELRVKVAASAWFEAELLAAWTQTQNDLARNGGRAAPSLD